MITIIFATSKILMDNNSQMLILYKISVNLHYFLAILPKNRFKKSFTNTFFFA